MAGRPGRARARRLPRRRRQTLRALDRPAAGCRRRRVCRQLRRDRRQHPRRGWPSGAGRRDPHRVRRRRLGAPRAHRSRPPIRCGSAPPTASSSGSAFPGASALCDATPSSPAAVASTTSPSPSAIELVRAGVAPADTLATAGGEPWVVAGPGTCWSARASIPHATQLPVRAPFVPWLADMLALRLAAPDRRRRRADRGVAGPPDPSSRRRGNAREQRRIAPLRHRRADGRARGAWRLVRPARRTSRRRGRRQRAARGVGARRAGPLPRSRHGSAA